MCEEGQSLTVPIASPSGVVVVLNGGRRVMNSATVPIQLFFSDEIARKNPAYLLIVEQNEREIGDDVNERVIGQRYLRRVDQGIYFVQLHKPGLHRIKVLIFDDEHASKDDRLDMLEREGNSTSMFKKMVAWIDSEVPEYSRFLGTKTVEFTVPEELFARKPEGLFGRAAWYLANRFFKKEPVDQCQYRRRLPILLALPFIYLGLYLGLGIWWIVRRILYLVAAVLLLIVLGVMLFFGFVPADMGIDIKALLRMRYKDMADEKVTTGLGYRGWKRKDNFTIVRMPITGIEIAALFAVSVGMIALFNLLFDGTATLFLLKVLCYFLVSVVVFIVLTATILKRIPFVDLLLNKLKIWERESVRLSKIKERSTRALRQEKDRDWDRERKQRRIAWLIASRGLSLIPESVDLRNIPRPQTSGARFVQRLKVGLLALRSRVCRPYAK